MSESAKEISKKSKSSFYYAFNLLPEEKRDAMNTVYAFCRETDDIVDEGNDPDDLKYEKLHKWRIEFEKAYRGHRLGITVTEMGTGDDSAMIHVEDIPEGSISVGSIVKVDFKLNRYDAPFIDNTKLSGNVRFAVTFKGIVTDGEGKQAVAMRVIFFPESYMSSRDRPYLDEMLQHLTRSRDATWYESLWSR